MKDLSAYGGHAKKYAQMMELVDMLDSKSGDRKVVGVQVPLWVESGIIISKYF